MKTLPYLNAIALTLASVLIPQLDTLLDVYRWAQANAAYWFCLKKFITTPCQKG